MVPSDLLSTAAFKITTYFKESDWLLKNFHKSENGLKAAMESKTKGTIRKSIKNCTRNRCQKWPCILFEVIYWENKQWWVLFGVCFFHKPEPCVLFGTVVLFSTEEYINKSGLFLPWQLPMTSWNPESATCKLGPFSFDMTFGKKKSFHEWEQGFHKKHDDSKRRKDRFALK